MSESSIKLEEAESESYPRIRKVGRIVGKTALCTLVVCSVATPFVNYWADKFGENVEPVTNGLENVGNKAGDLTQTLENGVPTVAEPLNRISESPFVASQTTTTSTVPKR